MPPKPRVRFRPIADTSAASHQVPMRRRNQTKRQRIKREESGVVAYLRRLAVPAVGWASLGLAAVLITRPSRLNEMLSGSVEWWRLISFAAVVLAFSFSIAAFNDWSRRRKHLR
jgi:hypothetical protein